MEFKEFEPRFKSAKTRFKLSAGLNLETFDTILSGTKFGHRINCSFYSTHPGLIFRPGLIVHAILLTLVFITMLASVFTAYDLRSKLENKILDKVNIYRCLL